MKKTLLVGVAALFLATGTTAQAIQVDVLPPEIYGRWCWSPTHDWNRWVRVPDDWVNCLGNGEIFIWDKRYKYKDVDKQETICHIATIEFDDGAYIVRGACDSDQNEHFNIGKG